MLHIDESFLDRVVRVPVGQVIELRLKENPATGFRWSFAADGAPACQIVADAFEPGAARPGAGGEHAWQIAAVHAGSCRVELVYRRPFAPSAPPAREFSVEVDVTE
jgi:inhibitor of cysteine peptidase